MTDLANHHEIRWLLDEVSHQITHLLRSQGELEKALLDDPSDEDFRQAFEENVITLQRKHARVVELKELLKKCDVAFRMDAANEDRIISTIPPADIQVAMAESMAESMAEMGVGEARANPLRHTNPIVVESEGRQGRQGGGVRFAAGNDANDHRNDHSNDYTNDHVNDQVNDQVNDHVNDHGNDHSRNSSIDACIAAVPVHPMHDMPDLPDSGAGAGHVSTDSAGGLYL
jgi:hypothetical protein